MGHYILIATAGPKPIFTASLGAGGEILAVKYLFSPSAFEPMMKISYHCRSVTQANGENEVITIGP